VTSETPYFPVLYHRAQIPTICSSNTAAGTRPSPGARQKLPTMPARTILNKMVETAKGGDLPPLLIFVPSKDLARPEGPAAGPLAARCPVIKTAARRL